MATPATLRLDRAMLERATPQQLAKLAAVLAEPPRPYVSPHVPEPRYTYDTGSKKKGR